MKHNIGTQAQRIIGSKKGRAKYKMKKREKSKECQKKLDKKII